MADQSVQLASTSYHTYRISYFTVVAELDQMKSEISEISKVLVNFKVKNVD